MFQPLLRIRERKMNYAEIKRYDIANGPGVRVSLFVSGCRHRCEDCFNEIAWDFSYGKEFTEDVQEMLLGYISSPQIKGITLLGGEPFEVENQRGLLPFVKKVRESFPEKTIWCFSGFTYEQLCGKEKSRARCEVTDELLSLIDVLVDGRYEKEKRNIMLRFRGSENQRLIDMNKTRECGEVVIWNDGE